MELKTVIVIDNSSYPLGGTAQVAFISALELKRRGYEVVYVSTDKSPNPALTEKGIRVECLDNLGIRDNPNRLEAAANGIWNADIGSKVKRILQHYDSQSTIIHIHGYLHTFSPSILKVCSQSGKKVILTLHDYFTLCPCGGFYDYKSKKVCNKSPMSLKCILCNCDKRNYYLFYNDKTGKSNFADDYLLYATYFSRMSNVKVSIYDLLNQGKMLQYPCQTLLYNLLFFIPRVLWEGKPYPYYKYFTSYVYYGVSNKVVPNMQFQVNIWSEFISNMGIFGYVAALYLVIWIVKKSEKSSNSIIMLSGTVFAFLYMMYGFEHIIQITYVVWAVSSIWTFIRSKFKLVHGR